MLEELCAEVGPVADVRVPTVRAAVVWSDEGGAVAAAGAPTFRSAHALTCVRSQTEDGGARGFAFVEFASEASVRCEC